MGRYSPTVLPEVPDPQRIIDQMYAGYLDSRQDKRAERGLEIRERESKTREEQIEIERAREGVMRGSAPTIEGTEHPLIPENELPGIGMQPKRREGIPALRDQLTQARQRYEPQVIAKPGALVPGMGVFADRPVLGLQQKASEPTVLPQTAPGYRQLTPDFYEDESRTPEARGREELRFRGALSEQAGRRNIEDRVAALVGAGVDPAQAEVIARSMNIPRESEDLGLEDELELRNRYAVSRERQLLEMRKKYGTGSGRFDDPEAFNSMENAVAYLERRHAVYETTPEGDRIFKGFDIPEEEIYQRARRLVRGAVEPGTFPEIEEEGTPMDEGTRGGLLGGRWFGPALDPFSAFREQPEGGAEPSAPGPRADHLQELRDAAGIVRGFPDEIVRQKLEELGFDPEYEIPLILKFREEG